MTFDLNLKYDLYYFGAELSGHSGEPVKRLVHLRDDVFDWCHENIKDYWYMTLTSKQSEAGLKPKSSFGIIGFDAQILQYQRKNRSLYQKIIQDRVIISFDSKRDCTVFKTFWL